MTRRPGFFGRVFGSGAKHSPEATLDSRCANVATTRNQDEAVFGFGEQGEKVGEQIASFTKRLDEIDTLRREFTSVAGPMMNFIVLHSDAQRKLAETTALLARERDEGRASRSDAVELRRENSTLANTLTGTEKQLESLKRSVESYESQCKSQQIARDDAVSRLQCATRQLALDAKRNQDQLYAHQSLGEDLNKVEQELAVEKARHLELQASHEAASAEVRRLETLVERLQPNLTAAKRRIGDLEAESGSSGATIGALELKLAADQEAHRSIEVSWSQEKVALETEVSALVDQIEALESRHVTTTRLFDQSRALLNEKSDAIRFSDRSAKEAITDKLVMERRHASAQDEIRRLQEQIAAFNLRNQEVQERCSMLSNAMAAKESQIEQMQARHDAVANQLEEVIKRHEQERLTIESFNRKLIEEVESERAERALAQGALSIARGSREKLLTQVEDLKRGRSEHQPDEVEPRRNATATANRSEGKPNIHIFRAE